jgi:hypothetical protein
VSAGSSVPVGAPVAEDVGTEAAGGAGVWVVDAAGGVLDEQPAMSARATATATLDLERPENPPAPTISDLRACSLDMQREQGGASTINER